VSLENCQTLLVPQKYKPGQVLFYQGNMSMGFYCVQSGTVALRRVDQEGHESIIRLLHPGDTIGYSSLFDDSENTATAVAVTNSKVRFLPKGMVMSLQRQNVKLSAALLKDVAFQLREAEEKAQSQAHLPVRTRFAQLLLEWRDHYGTMDKEGNLIIDLPLPKQDIALMISTRPETLSRTIHAMAKDEVARFEKSKVIVSDLDKLLDEVEE
jgi:CRP/FNR family transcriptional regulator